MARGNASWMALGAIMMFLVGGIVLEGTRDVTITGNTFSSLPKSVELLEPASVNILFSNNQLIEAPSDLKP